MCAFIASVNLTQLLFLVMLVTAIVRILIHDLAASRGEMRHSNSVLRRSAESKHAKMRREASSINKNRDCCTDTEANGRRVRQLVVPHCYREAVLKTA